MVDFKTILKISYRALLRNKSRAFLTMLGIIIGVGSVIAMVSIGLGAQKSSQSHIESAGTNMILVIASSGRKGAMHGGFGITNKLSVKDSEALKNESKYIMNSSPIVRSVVRAVYKNLNWSTALMGSNEEYFTIRNWKFSQGRPFEKTEVESKLKVAVIGEIVKKELFGQENPIGKIIRLNKIPFKIIGVLEAKGRSGFRGNSDDVVIIPITTAMQRFYKKDYIPIIFNSAVTMEDSQKAKEDIKAILRQRHRIKPDMEDDFMLRSQEDWKKASSASNKVFTILLGAIASVSLLVGGIGIMNIMLVSVTERVREIGIRMAVGAKKKDIMFQFIVEAAMLSFIGGFIGVLVGLLLSYVVFRITKWPTSISINSIIVSLLFSAGIGIFFGFYPAWKASNMEPIESLRTK